MNITDVTEVNNKGTVSTISFTKDQQKAYDELITFMNDDYNESDFKRALIGPAGTGKTFLVRALLKNCKLSYSTIGLSAPTHKACRVLQESIKLPNIKVNTLQSDLGLRLNFDIDNFDYNHPNFDPNGKIKIDEYKLYIIDEASMINRGLVMFIEKLCKQYKTKLIYIGDASQLSPVKEKYSSALKAIKVYELKEIVRQGENNPISKLLDILRNDIKNKSYDFLRYISQNQADFNDDNSKGYLVCNPEYFKNLININFNDEEFTKNVDLTKVVAYTNTQVNNWNRYIRNSIIKDADKSILTKHDLLISYTTIVNIFNDAVIKNSEEYIIHDIVNYTHTNYGLKGFMVKFTAIHGGKVTTPLFIVDHTDNFSLQMYVKIANQLINDAKGAPVKLKSTKWKEYYKFKESCLLLTNILDSRGNVIFSRDLDYGFALTSHKSQGSTFNVTFVDVNNICYDKYGSPYPDCEEMNRRLYVACSRAKDKLYLCYGK